MFISKSKKNTSKKQEETQKKATIPKTVRESIPYRYVYPDSGIIEIRQGVFAKSYLLGDINYKTANEDVQENLLKAFMKVLNSMGAYAQCQETIFNRNIGEEEIKKKAFYELKYDGLDSLRVELNKRREANIVEGKNNLIKERYYTVAIQESSYSDALTTFARLDAELADSFYSVGGATATPVDTNEKLTLLYNIYNMDKSEPCPLLQENISLDSLKRKGITSKDVIGPSGFKFEYDHMRIGTKYARALYLKSLPNVLGDNILEELTDVSCSSLTSINFYSVPSDVALKNIGHNITATNSELIDKMKRAGRGGYAADPELLYPKLMDSQRELFRLRDDLMRNDQKMFYMNLVVVLFADSMEELNDATEATVAVGRKHMVVIDNLLGQQNLGLDSALPLAHDRLALKTRLLSESLAVFMPFVNKELQHPTGVFYGQHASSRNLIRIDRKLLDNGNGFIFGTPGCGKSVTAKDEMINVYLEYPEDTVFVVDPEGEYTPVAEMLGGTVVKISQDSSSHLNPLDFHNKLAEDDDPVWYKTDFLINMFESSIINDRFGGGLTSGAKTLIDKCARTLYLQYFDELKKRGEQASAESSPTLEDFYNLLHNEPGRDARELAQALELYTKGSLNYFNHKTNVKINSRFVVFDISEMGSALTTLGLLVVLDFIWRRIIENGARGKNTWFYVDEAHLLFRKDTSAEFMRDLYKRARKQGGINTSITQNVEDLITNDIARTMIYNSNFVVMLRQNNSEKMMLAELLNIPNSQLSFITESPKGQGLIYTGEKSVVPFVNKIPKGELYDAMTTKVGEKAVTIVEEDKDALLEYE